MVKRLAQHFFAIAGGQAINLLGTVLLVPLFLAHWTTIAYGEWLALSSLANYLSTLDLGMSAAVSNRMLAAHVHDDRAEYVRCLHSAAAFYTGLAGVGSALGGLAAWLLPLSAWLGLKQTSAGDAAWITWLLALQVLWMMPIGLLGNVFRTLGDPAKTQWVNNAKFLGLLGVTAVAVALGCPLRSLALLQLTPMVLMTLYLFWDLRRFAAWFQPGFAGASKSTVQALLRPSLLFVGIMVAMAITQQGSVLVVSSVLGGAAVAVFVTTRTLTNLLMQAVGMVKNAAWPDLTILHAQENWGRLRTTNHLLVAASGSLCIGIGAALWFEGPGVLGLWTHHKLTVSPLFFRLMLLYIILQALWITGATLPAAINRHGQLSRSSLTAAVVGVALVALLVPRLGLLGVPVSLMFGEAVACYHFVVKDTCAVLQESYAPFAARLWLGGALILMLALAAGSMAHQFAWGPTLFRWAQVGAVTLLTTTLLAWWVWLNASERRVVAGRLRRLLGRPAREEGFVYGQ